MQTVLSRRSWVIALLPVALAALLMLGFAQPASAGGHDWEEDFRKSSDGDWNNHWDINWLGEIVWNNHDDDRNNKSRDNYWGWYDEKEEWCDWDENEWNDRKNKYEGSGNWSREDWDNEKNRWEDDCDNDNDKKDRDNDVKFRGWSDDDEWKSDDCDDEEAKSRHEDKDWKDNDRDNEKDWNNDDWERSGDGKDGKNGKDGKDGNDGDRW